MRASGLRGILRGSPSVGRPKRVAGPCLCQRTRVRYFPLGPQFILEGPSQFIDEREQFREEHRAKVFHGFARGARRRREIGPGFGAGRAGRRPGEGYKFHSPRWHGNTVLLNGSRTDVLSIAPAQILRVDMQRDNPGIWLYHCHVSDHMTMGMSSRYQVLA